MEESLRLNVRTIERFWTHVEVTETCWLWQDDITSVGYGRFSFHRFGVSREAIRKVVDGRTWSHVA